MLLDRSGAASLVAAAVRFRALAQGEEPMVFDSQGTYLFGRTADGWRIVSFTVVLDDRERAG